MNSFGSFVDELELAIQQGSSTRRTEMLRQVTDLFLGGAGNFNDQQIDVFDDVLVRLTKQVESNVLAEIGAKLAPIDHAPYELLRSFAHHDEIAVAGPVLTLSKRLSEGDLIEIAKTKGQAHLGAISLTVSHISAPRRCCDWSVAAWASRQASDERADQPSTHGCD